MIQKFTTWRESERRQTFSFAVHTQNCLSATKHGDDQVKNSFNTKLDYYRRQYFFFQYLKLGAMKPAIDFLTYLGRPNFRGSNSY